MKRKFLFDTWRKEPTFQALCSALLSCKTHEDMQNALGDLLTLSELKTVSERLEVAKSLAQGLSYRQAAAAAQASTTTVTKVAQKIENGTGGLRKMLRVHRHYREVPEIGNRKSEIGNIHHSGREDIAKGALQKALERSRPQ
jgi:TrpR-related protein YerC/YecD